MAPKPMPWFRYYSEARKDVKLIKAARMAGVSVMEITGFWVTLLSIANESPVRGALYVTLHDCYNIDDVTVECNAQKKVTERVLSAFVQFGLITIVDGTIHITNWDKRQFSSDKVADRVRNYRMKQRCNNDVTPSDTETDTETDTELRKEEEGAPAAAYSDDVQLERIYCAVTGQITIPSTVRENALSALRAILADKRTTNETIFYLRPFWAEWKNIRHYSQTNAGWLTDWAVTGQIPPPKGNGKPGGETLADVFGRS